MKLIVTLLLQSLQSVTCTLGVTTIILSSSFIGVMPVSGRTIQLNWTSNGVKEYTSTPLTTELGDILELECHENISNLFIQSDRIQYDSCNASAGSGVFHYNGICFQGNPALLTLTENSQSLENTINFMNNHIYYLTSYSDGHLRADDDDFTSGGQCEDGLKMIIAIGETESVTLGNRYGNSSHDSGPSPPTATQLAVSNPNKEAGHPQLQTVRLLSAVIAPAAIVILAVALLIIALVYKARYTKKTQIEGNNTNWSETYDTLFQYRTTETASDTQPQFEPVYDEIAGD